jgi:hypothetical protein
VHASLLLVLVQFIILPPWEFIQAINMRVRFSLKATSATKRRRQGGEEAKISKRTQRGRAGSVAIIGFIIT